MSSPESPLVIPELTLEQRIAITAHTLGELSTAVMAGDLEMMPPEVFHGWAAGNYIPTVELGLVQPSEETENGVNVYMLSRRADDPIEKWRKKLHIPGVIPLGSKDKPNPDDEEDLSCLVERVVGEAEGGLDLLEKPIPYATVLRVGARGPEITTRLIVPVSGMPKKGNFFDVDVMLRPENRDLLLETHDRAITRVRDAAQRLSLV